MTKKEIIEQLDLAKDWIMLVNNNPESEEVEGMINGIKGAIEILTSKK